MRRMNTPSHIAVIIDGNRRYAKRAFLEPWKGHESGAETVEKTIEWCSDLQIKELTFYALSIENLNREKREVEALLNLMKRWLKKIKTDERIKKNQVKIKFIGRLYLLPEDIRKLAAETQEETKNHNKLLVNFCIAYGGRQELVDAIKILTKSNLEVNEENIQKNLYLQSEPQLIIRTGGHTRTSNFLPWQTIYSEWIFLQKLWPEFTKDDLIECIEKFNQIQRNFGK